MKSFYIDFATYKFYKWRNVCKYRYISPDIKIYKWRNRTRRTADGGRRMMDGGRQLADGGWANCSSSTIRPFAVHRPPSVVAVRRPPSTVAIF
ncbi:MAG TPA: hypothetical protein ENJ53_06665 [Phaeodactylibacter sp.]|nr:hypothetical protein [Phaeodactylibacter sp.]